MQKKQPVAVFLYTYRMQKRLPAAGFLHDKEAAWICVKAIKPLDWRRLFKEYS